MKNVCQQFKNSLHSENYSTHCITITFSGILFFLPTWGPPFHPGWWLPVHN